MDLVAKDIGLFQAVADRAKIPLELNPLLISIFADGIKRFGPRELSPNIIKRLEETAGLDIRAAGFPAQIVDDEPEKSSFSEEPDEEYDYVSMTKAELIELAKKRNLSTSGNKKKLIERLENSD